MPTPGVSGKVTCGPAGAEVATSAALRRGRSMVPAKQCPVRLLLQVEQPHGLPTGGK